MRFATPAGRLRPPARGARRRAGCGGRGAGRLRHAARRAAGRRGAAGRVPAARRRGAGRAYRVRDVYKSAYMHMHVSVCIRVYVHVEGRSRPRHARRGAHGGCAAREGPADSSRVTTVRARVVSHFRCCPQVYSRIREAMELAEEARLERDAALGAAEGRWAPGRRSARTQAARAFGERGYPASRSSNTGLRTMNSRCIYNSDKLIPQGPRDSVADRPPGGRDPPAVRSRGPEGRAAPRGGRRGARGRGGVGPRGCVQGGGRGAGAGLAVDSVVVPMHGRFVAAAARCARLLHGTRGQRKGLI